jgi:hypothetical protein
MIEHVKLTNVYEKQEIELLRHKLWKKQHVKHDCQRNVSREFYVKWLTRQRTGYIAVKKWLQGSRRRLTQERKVNIEPDFGPTRNTTPVAIEKKSI